MIVRKLGCYYILVTFWILEGPWPSKDQSWGALIWKQPITVGNLLLQVYLYWTASMKGRRVRCLAPSGCSRSAFLVNYVIKCIFYRPLRFDRKVVWCILQSAAVYFMEFPKATIYLPLNLRTLFWCAGDAQLMGGGYHTESCTKPGLSGTTRKEGGAHFSPSTERHLPKRIPSSCRSPGPR